MKATVKVTLSETGFRTYDAYAEVIDRENSDTVYDHTERFDNTNAVYPAYKALAKCINHLPRLGVDRIDVETNCVAMVKELNGQYNENMKLVQIIRDRLTKTGVAIDSITLAC